jgi:hypothetical protein
MAYCSGVSSFLHSSADFSTLRSGVGLPFLAYLRTSFQFIAVFFSWGAAGGAPPAPDRLS